ncbi:nicotinate-nucleotide adenylyltransferase [[Pantoea] beijingensis]|uniref:Probable nicotinate-nucleotide adenylyltransferase n=1 Tax=[Pantoea] beijingensis TaxID=1324864 RepID=A0A443IA49_9GAMM|nr:MULTISPECIES: nicotinate-nucleotide adenylyltransferase [Erwiniaceae]RWR00777.1 nicotinate-nucleotide adenylyltransferase [[Pantoea] beijingensis]
MASLHALLGGTFDPIHYGHLRPVEALAQLTGLQKVTLLPNNVPPHRPQPEASSAQRVRMVELAIGDRPLFTLDRREMQRKTPSYTVETLEALRGEYGEQQPLAFIIGQDSLLTLHTWHRWHDLLTLCHLLVCRRPGYPTKMETPALQSWLDTHLTAQATALHQQPSGLIFQADTPLVPVSATEIRQRRHQGQSCDDLLPPAVIDYIEREGLYLKSFT